MKRLRLLSLLLATLFAFISSACTDLKLFAVNAPLDLEAEQIKSDLVFDETNNLALDLYLPKDKTKKAPLIVFIYGGSWQDGKKEDYKFVAAYFVAQGYAVAIPDYQKYPAVKFPVFVEDGAVAIKWLQEKSDNYKINTNHIILMGHSAGAFNAAMLTYNQSYLEKVDVDSKAVRSFVGLSGPYAFEPQAEDMKAIFGPPENYPAMRIPNFVTTGAPPALLLHGKEDTIVGRFNTERLEKALKENDIPVTVHYYDGMDHVAPIAEFSWVKKKKSALLKDIDDFLKKPKD